YLLPRSRCTTMLVFPDSEVPATSSLNGCLGANGFCFFEAGSRGGKCLSKEYVSNITPMYWKCIKGHEWFATFNSIKNGKTWCPTCSDTRFSILVAKELARNKNGECLSKNIFIVNQLYYAVVIKDMNGVLHSLDVLKDIHGLLGFIVFKEGLGAHIVAVPTLNMPKKLARSKDGECLSNVCTNHKTYLHWRCSKSHEWLTPSVVLNHPAGLELVIYYPQYGFATEQKRDQLKKELCEENWIILRYVWYYEDPYKVIPGQLRKLGLIE
ncbi:1091_t:CDS:2, partial [Gigaspora margarita]